MFPWLFIAYICFLLCVGHGGFIFLYSLLCLCLFGMWLFYFEVRITRWSKNSLLLFISWHPLYLVISCHFIPLFGFSYFSLFTFVHDWSTWSDVNAWIVKFLPTRGQDWPSSSDWRHVFEMLIHYNVIINLYFEEQLLFLQRILGNSRKSHNFSMFSFIS